MPDITVIVPNYKHATYLIPRLESIFSQDFVNYEVVLLDDHSPDDSVEILKQYAKRPQVSKFVVNTSNSGSPFRQWKKGLDLAEGKYIWIAESDDFIAHDFLSKAWLAIQSDQQIGLVYAHSVVVDENGAEINHLYHDEISSSQWRSDYVVDGKEEIRRALGEKNTIANTSSVLVRRDLLEKHLGVAMSFHSTGDWYLWLHILNEPGVKIAYLASTQNFFRSHGQTTRGIGKINFMYVEEYFRCLHYAKPSSSSPYNESSLLTLKSMMMAVPLRSILNQASIRKLLLWLLSDRTLPLIVISCLWRRTIAVLGRRLHRQA